MAVNDFSSEALDQLVLRWQDMSARRGSAQAARCSCGCNCPAGRDAGQRPARAVRNGGVAMIAESLGSVRLA